MKRIGLKDPRWLQIVLLGSYLGLGKVFFQFSVTGWQVLASVAACVAMEWGLARVRGQTLPLPLSPVITGLGIALALRAGGVIPFVLAAIVAIGLKHFARYRGRHIFNPSNSGIAAVSLLLPVAAATAPLQWGFDPLALAAISLFGAYLVYTVRRLPVILSFLAVFVAIQELRHLWEPVSLNATFNDFMWGSLFVFTFNMITDPKTSPAGWKRQAVYGVSIAVAAQGLLQWDVHNAVYLSLALICLLRFWWRWLRDRREETKGASTASP